MKGGYPILGVIKLRKDETYKIFPNITKAKKIINWRPKVSFTKDFLKLFNIMKSYNNPLVSIIMNCYNGDKYLKTSVNSILKQDYKNWELIFWDNKSTDKK